MVDHKGLINRAEVLDNKAHTKAFHLLLLLLLLPCCIISIYLIMSSNQISVQFEQLDCYIREPVQFKLDFVSLFGVVQDVVHHTTSAAEKCLLGNNEITIQECKPVASLNCPLSILKKLHCAVTCEGEGDPSASIARILSNYSEAGRAVMTLAAFAMSYEDLLFYVENRTLNPFASFRTFEIIRVQRDDTVKKAIVELNTLTTLTVQLVEFILQLEKLSKEDHFIDNFSRVRAINTNVKYYASFAIQVLVICMRQVNSLTSDMVATGKALTSVVSSLKVELKKIKATYEEYISQEAEKYYIELHKIIRSGGNIVEVITRMMYPEQPFFECYNRPQPQVEVEKVLTGNNVLLFITELNISKDDYSVLRMIHEKIEQQKLNYKIVWIPIVKRKRVHEGKGWTQEELARLNDCKKGMPWYIVNYEATKPILGVRYIKETWKYSYNPMVVVLNQSGMVECSDAMHIIRAWQTWPCPYNFDPIVHPDPGMRPIIFPLLNREIVEEEYIIIYGGKDVVSMTKFDNNVKTLAGELRKAKITLTPFAFVEKNSTVEITQFWTRVESMGFARLQWNLFGEQHIHTTTQIQKLISVKEESGWAMVCKGSSVIACASGTILMNTVAEYKIWLKEIGKYSFETCFINYLEKKRGGERIPCCHVPFEGFNGWLPVDVECPDCGERMERIVTYKCCHPTLYK